MALQRFSLIAPGLAHELADIPRFDGPPNLELVTEFDSDLTIAFKDSSLFYEGMQAIAPLVVCDAAYHTDWKSSTAFWAEVFGKQDAYADMIDTYKIALSGRKAGGL